VVRIGSLALVILSSSSHSSNQEFRRYRKLVAWTTIVLVALGCIYAFISVVVSIQRQRRGVVEDRISPQLTGSEIRGCFDELRDVSIALEKHLENAYHLLGGYDSEEARRWSDEGEIWRKRWYLLGQRCRLEERQPNPPHKDLEAMAAAHLELGSIQHTYSRELLRFGSELAPRLDRINKRVDEIGENLGDPKSPTGATK
jgi:hypothetical protein